MTSQTTYYPDGDVLYVALSDERPARTQILDGYRMIDYDEAGNLVGVEFLGASDGVDFSGLPEQHRLQRLLPQFLYSKHSQEPGSAATAAA